MAVNDLPAIWQKERTSENLTCMTCILPAALSHLISLASLLSFTVGCCAYQLLVLAPVTSSVLAAPHLRSCWVHTLSFSELLGRRRCYGGVFFRRNAEMVLSFRGRSFSMFSMFVGLCVRCGEWRKSRCGPMNVGFSQRMPAAFDFGGFFWRNP